MLHLHPYALQSQQLNVLPVSDRSLARTAMRDFASAKLIDALSLRTSQSQRLALLPICYTHLNPISIPSLPSNVDELPAMQKAVVERAVAALQLVDSVQDIPFIVEPFLIPRVLAWYRFLDVHDRLVSTLGLRIFRYDFPLLDTPFSNAIAICKFLIRFYTNVSAGGFVLHDGMRALAGRVFIDCGRVVRHDAANARTLGLA